MASTAPAGPSAGHREHRAFLVEVAWLHYELGLTQDAIAARHGVSRSTISRALSEAQALGIVQVVVTEPPPDAARLGDSLSSRYGAAAHVAVPLAEGDGRTAVARVTARVIERAVMLGRVTIAASWGRTLAQAALQVRPRRTTGVVVVDAVGHAAGGELAPAVDVTRGLATTLGAAIVHLPSPAFADSPESLRFLQAAPSIRAALDAARGADLTLVSVGVVGAESLLLQAGLISATVMEGIVEAGGVGEILGIFYDAAGRALEVPDVLPVGLSLDDLRASRRVVAAAAGAGKAEALRAALAGGIVGELVVDRALAEALVQP